jgi:hypothetical protein
MRQAKYPWLLFMLALAAIAVPIAQGTSAAKDPRVPGLVKKVAALQSSVATLKGDVTSLKGDVSTLQGSLATLQKQADALTTKANCIGAQPTVLRGQGASEGYVYTPNNGTDFALVTAFDATRQGETPQLLMATVNPQCVTGSRSFFWQSGISARRAAYSGRLVH